MPANRTYDPRYNAKLYVPKLTEEQRRARATPLENLRSLRFRSDTPATPAALPSPPQFSTPEIATPQDPTPEAPTVDTPTTEVPTAEVPTPEPAMQEAPAPDDLPAAWEVVFAAFPELYPEHATEAGGILHPTGHFACSCRMVPPRTRFGIAPLGEEIQTCGIRKIRRGSSTANSKDSSGHESIDARGRPSENWGDVRRT